MWVCQPAARASGFPRSPRNSTDSQLTHTPPEESLAEEFESAALRAADGALWVTVVAQPVPTRRGGARVAERAHAAGVL
jgi:hypothetical protein